MQDTRVMGILFAFVVSLMLITGCDRTGKGSTGSGLFGARIDTITVRDTVTVRDTITMRDTVTVRDTVVAVDTVLVAKEVVRSCLKTPCGLPQGSSKLSVRRAIFIGRDVLEPRLFSSHQG